MAIILASASLHLMAQNQAGQISGVVLDQSGSAVVDAKVTLRNTTTGATITVDSDGIGHFAFKGLVDGTYEVSVDATGFEHLTHEDMTIVNGQYITVDLGLKVANRKETVTVIETNGYTAPEVSTISKIDVPIGQIPLSVQVVPNGVIRDQLALRLPDITRNVSGVQTNFGYGALYEAFALRGFETNVTLRNGERVSGGIGRSSVDVANIEDVEVLKGPAAMIYGRLEPGGMINVVTKKPLDGRHYSLQQEFGSYDLYRTTLDATGPITSDGSLLYRGIFSFLDSNQFITFAPHGRTYFVAPSVSWRPIDKLIVNANVEYRNMDPLIANGIPAIGNRPADIPIALYLGGDIGDQANVRRKLLDFNASYQFTPNWNIRGSVAAAFDDIDFEQFFGGSLEEITGPTFGDYTNIPWFDKRRSNGTNVVLDLNGHFRTDALSHNLLLGSDYYNLDFSDRGFVNGWAPVDMMNIFRPVFRRSTAYGAHASLATTPPDWTSVGTTQWHGIYAQDQIGLLRSVRLLVGGRYDWTETEAGSITLEYADPGSTLDDVSKTKANQHKFSPLLGLIYQPLPWLSFYGNYVSSLGTWGTSNVIAVNIKGHPLPAQQSHSYEGGLKIETLGGRFRSTLAIFDLTKTHVATRDLSSPDPTALRAIGEAHSTGVEVDISGTLTSRLSVIASYAYTDAKFSKDNNGLQDLLIANVPRHSGSLWLRSEIIRQKLSGGAGVFARGQRQGDNENTFQLPGYATIDAFVAYSFHLGERGRLTPQVNFINLLDKRYFLNTNVYDAFPRLGIMPGQPFTVIGSVKWEF
jgi:iron complex outermembrane receptor protein